MEFSVFRSDLLKELELVHGAIERKASVPVLSNVLIDAQNGNLALSATNDEDYTAHGERHGRARRLRQQDR